MRQNIIGLERKWLAKDYWFRLSETVTRLCVVDMRQWHRSMNLKGAPNALARSRQCETNNFETEHDHEIEVTKFTDMLCKTLEDNFRKHHDPQRSHINTRESHRQDKLEKIVGPDGRMARPKTSKQRDVVRRAEEAVRHKCHVSRNCFKRD